MVVVSERAATERAAPFLATGGGLKVAVILVPKASANRVGGVADGGDGKARLKVSVTAAAEGGKANAALIKLLAKTWRLPKTAFKITAGPASRRKTLFIEGDTEILLENIKRWLEQHPKAATER